LFFEKEITMTRKSTAAFFAILFVFILACNFVTQPIQDVQNLAGTAESFATALPLETLQALASAIPVETLSAASTTVSQFGNMFDPQGTPVSEWNGIPIMPQATAGQEFDTGNYSFRFTGTVKDANDFYTAELANLGWSTTVTMPGDEQGGLLVMQKDGSILTVTITNMNDGSIVVLLTLV
jgi:hypothetical protein